MNDVADMECVIVDPQGNIVMEIPYDHLDSCFCKRLEVHTGQQYEIDHFFARCKDAANQTTYVVYNCPFGLTNIIVSAFDSHRFAGALQIGPILTSDPNDPMKYALTGKSTEVAKMQDLKAYLNSLPRETIDYVIKLAEFVNTLVNDDLFTFKNKKITMKPPEKPAKDHDAPNDIICSVQEFINQRFTDSTLSLDDVARNVYVHPSYLSRLFSKQFNCHFRTYINTLRINLAIDLLAKTDKSIGEICQEVGFTDHSYFNRVFRQEKGMTPSEYRNKHGRQ